MSYSSLLELFTGRLEAQKCAKYVLSLKSPQRVKKFLISRHKIFFPKGDKEKNKKWDSYPKIERTQQIKPVTSKNLANGEFMTRARSGY